jgi:hypothetical protein
MNYKGKQKLVRVNRRVKLAYGAAIARSLSSYNYKAIGEINDNDYVMVGYPKSGNTWMQNLLACILYGIDGYHLPDHITQEIIPDLDYKVFYKRMSNVMAFKTHDLPKAHFKNIIHLVRDPRDVMASYFAMVSGKGGKTTIEKMVMEGDQLLFGTWWDHMKAYKANQPKCRMLTVRYEDLISNTAAELRRIINFMGIDRDNDLIDRVLRGNSIATMKMKERHFGFDKRSIHKDKWVKGASFVRNGKAGSGKKELSPEVLDYIILRSEEYMKDYSYKV